MRHCMDFAMPIGTLILVVADGVVTEKVDGYKKNYHDSRMADRCNYLTIKHANGDYSFYVHLAWHSAKVRIGDGVKTGQPIALSGETGYAAYPHLHFGIYNEKGENIPVIFRD